MPTIINSPGGTDSSSLLVIVGIILTGAVIILFFIFGLPALQNMNQPQTQSPSKIEVEIAAPTLEAAPKEVVTPTP